jgi:hypothetical protein
VARRAIFALALLGAGCGQLVQYSDELVEPRTGRSAFVVVPATAGGVVGFVVGVPVDIVALPITYPIYLIQKHTSPSEADLTSTVLFPTFAFGRAGTILIGLPFDAIEFALWRGWQPPESLNREQRERIEYTFDERTLPVHPVQPVHGIVRGADSRPASGR